MGRAQVNAAFWTMVLLQTLGAVDMPGKGERKMPAPRSYLAIITLYSVLTLAADAGAGRAAAAAGWIVVLVGAVKGPFGNQVTNVVNAVAPPGAGAQPLPPIPPDTSGGTTA